MTVTLPPRLEAIVEAKVESGQYDDAQAVIEEAFRLLEERDRPEYLRAATAKGLAQIERGEEIEYTPALRDQRWESAMRKFREGQRPKADVLP